MERIAAALERANEMNAESTAEWKAANERVASAQEKLVDAQVSIAANSEESLTLSKIRVVKETKGHTA